MVVFNLFAVAEVLVAVVIYAAIGLVAPDLGDSADLVGIGVWMLITGISEFLGFRGRLFWLPSNLFAGFGLSMELMPHLGNAAFAVGLLPSVLFVGWCFWRRSQEDDDEEVYEEAAVHGQQPQYGQQPPHAQPYPQHGQQPYPPQAGAYPQQGQQPYPPQAGAYPQHGQPVAQAPVASAYTPPR